MAEKITNNRDCKYFSDILSICGDFWEFLECLEVERRGGKMRGRGGMNGGEMGVDGVGQRRGGENCKYSRQKVCFVHFAYF